MGDGGSFAPPIPQEFPPLPLRDSRGHEGQPKQGEGPGVGVREASAFFRNLLRLRKSAQTARVPLGLSPINDGSSVCGLSPRLGPSCALDFATHRWRQQLEPYLMVMAVERTAEERIGRCLGVLGAIQGEGWWCSGDRVKTTSGLCPFERRRRR